MSTPILTSSTASPHTSGTSTPSDIPGLRASLPSCDTLNNLELDFSVGPKAAPGTPPIPIPTPTPTPTGTGHVTPERTSKPKGSAGNLWGNRAWDRAFA